MLIPQWRNWFKLYSVRVMSVLGGLSIVEGHFRAFSRFIPDGWLPYITAGFAVAAIAGRLTAQPRVMQEALYKNTLAEQRYAQDAEDDEPHHGED